MKEFLGDYGLVWTEGENSVQKDKLSVAANHFDHCLPTRIEMSGNSLSDETLDRLLMAIDFLNETIHANEMKVVIPDAPNKNENRSRIARLELPKCIPLKLFKDGIVMFAGPFRSYHEISTLKLVQDLLDGFFPSELQSRFPEGVPLATTDCRHELFSRTNQICPFLPNEINSIIYPENQYFPGVGRRLGGDESFSRLTNTRGQDTLGQDTCVADFVELNRGCAIEAVKNDDSLIPYSEVQTQINCTTCHFLSNTPSLDSNTKFENIVSELSTVVEDKILSVIGGTEMRLGGFDLKIRSPSGDEIYNMNVNISDTVSSIYQTLDKFLINESSRSYRLIHINQNNSLEKKFVEYVPLTNMNSTLSEAGIGGSSLINMELISN